MGKKKKSTSIKRHKKPLEGPQLGELFDNACLLHQQGDLNGAEKIYRELIKSHPQNGDLWRNLGALLRKKGAFQDSRICAEKALELNKEEAALWGNYGNVLRDLELYEESLDAIERGLKIEPNNPGLIQSKAITLSKFGKQQEIVNLLGHLLEEETPKGGNNLLAELLLELGNAFHILQQPEQALKCWQKGSLSAVGIKRLHIGLNTAQVLCEQKRYKEAKMICERLESIFNNECHLLYAQGVIAKGLDEIEESCNLFEKALAVEPGYPICLNTYGLLLRDIGRIHHAKDCFEKALKYDPKFGAAMNNLGSILKDITQYKEALKWLRRGAEALTNNPAAHSNVLFTLVGYELEPASKRFEEAKRFAEKVNTSPYPRWTDRLPDPDPNRVLKIGLVSPDFCRHAVSYFVEPLLEQWDRKKVQVTLYSCGNQHDDYTARLQGKTDQWRDLRGQPDESCIAQIQRDEIDILIDLAGHTSGNRLAVFAAKPAPIQATYLGYYGTTGLEQVDYWVTDKTLHPPEFDQDDPCSEERWRLDRCYVSYRPLASAPDVQDPPCIKSGMITFGSFNQSRKITEVTASNWMAVLTAFPNSRLFLKSKNLGESSEQERIRTLFGTLGLNQNRLELAGHSPTIEDHLGAYKEIDIALDTFPYTGCTTTADALWMGVPVLTVCGNSMVSRQAAAVLAGAGYPEWICTNQSSLIEIAGQLLGDLKVLKKIRKEQRQTIQQSDLLNHKDLAVNLEESFREWWQKWLTLQGFNINGPWRPREVGSDSMSINPLMPLTRPIPLWIGELPESQAKLYKESGYILVKTKTLDPWSDIKLVFKKQASGDRMMVQWQPNDIKSISNSLTWWNRVFPQLRWEEIQNKN